MYRDTGAGKSPVPPALMAMATLVQAYLGVSDAEMVELTVVDLRVQMVLDQLGADRLHSRRGRWSTSGDRLIRADLDRRLLERTVELARDTAGFDGASFHAPCVWRWTPALLKVRAASKTRSISWGTRPASWFDA